MTNAKSYYNVTQDDTTETYKASDFYISESGNMWYWSFEHIYNYTSTP